LRNRAALQFDPLEFRFEPGALIRASGTNPPILTDSNRVSVCRLDLVLAYVQGVHEAKGASEPVYDSRLPRPLARLKRWLVAHHMTLMAITDTPHSIALGSAIGIFFGFTPLYPLKTLLSIAVAWICRCNKIAAAIAVTLHDVMIWAMPAIYVAEYHFGCWILNRPVAQRVHFRQFRLHDYAHWHVFSRVVWPTFWPAFVGSLFVAIPSAIFVYFLMRLLISRARTPQKSE
jgi:uncharacterized protein (DUF2062 family)